MSTTDIRRGLYAALTGASAVTDLLATATSVYHDQAPENAAYPFVVISKQSAHRTRAFDATAFTTETWLVKAIDRSTTADTAEAISEAAQGVLTNGTLTLSGDTVVDLYPSGDIDHLEVVGDQTYRHHGAFYRVTVTPN